VATPATEDVLLNVVLHGTKHHVETLVRQFRRVQEVEELSREARQHASRRLTYFHDDDGSPVVKLQLPAETGALLLKALEAALPEIPLPVDCEGALHVSAETSMAVIAGDPPTLSARRADALVVSSSRATKAVCSRDAATCDTSTATTSTIGSTAARRNCRTSSRCAVSITARCMRAASASSASTTERGDSSTGTECPSSPA